MRVRISRIDNPTRDRERLQPGLGPVQHPQYPLPVRPAAFATQSDQAHLPALSTSPPQLDYHYRASAVDRTGPAPSSSHPPHASYDVRHPNERTSQSAATTRSTGTTLQPTPTSTDTTSGGRYLNSPEAPPTFVSTLNLQVRYLATIDRGRYENVATHLLANPTLAQQDPSALIREAAHAFRYYNTYGITPDGDKSKYAESCIQQCILLGLLQKRLGSVDDTQRSRQGRVLQDFAKALKDSKSEVRRQLFEAWGPLLDKVKSQSQDRGRARQDSINSPRRANQESINSNFANLTLYDGQAAALPGSGGSRVQTNRSSSDQVQDSGEGEKQAPVQLYSATIPAHHRGSGLAESTFSYQNNYSMGSESLPQQHTSSIAPPLRPTDRPLDPSYYVRSSSHYRKGTVFAMVWSDAYNDSHQTGDFSRMSDHISYVIHGERVYSSIRRMVVVREGRGFSVCIQITTYGRRGLLKFANYPETVEAHSIIYMDNTQPKALKDEPRSSKRPIAVTPASPDQKLEPSSRLCYSQPHTVQHTVKCKIVGRVTERDFPYVENYFYKLNKLD